MKILNNRGYIRKVSFRGKDDEETEKIKKYIAKWIEKCRTNVLTYYDYIAVEEGDDFVEFRGIARDPDDHDFTSYFIIKPRIDEMCSSLISYMKFSIEGETV